MELRHYQRAAIDAVYAHLQQRDDSACVVVPTGGGKSLVIATICKDAVVEWGGRVLLISHVKELLQQNAAHIKKICPALSGAIGVYSASLGSRDTDHPIIVAGIQSIYKKACDLGRFDLILIDEAHMIPDEGEGMYRKFLAEAKIVNPNVRIVGFTATPYRMKSGFICEPENILNHVCYEVGVKQLIDEGFLCRLISKAGAVKADLSGVHVRGGEFVADELEAAMDKDPLVIAACDEIIEYAWDRKSIIVFASGVAHGKHIVEVLRSKGQTAESVFGETPTKERDRILDAAKRGEIRHLVNVGVLTTGFDSPLIDCVALMRPTMSPGLYYQMVGRALRLHPGKQNALVLDFAHNIIQHGPIDQINVQPKKQGSEGGKAPAKECPECNGIISAAATVCEYCGHEFKRELKHEPEASNAGPLSGQVRTEVRPVVRTIYSKHIKRGDPDDPPTMRVEYITSSGLLSESASEWICIEHEGWAQQKAASWWGMRSLCPFPGSVDDAVALANGGALAETQSITVSVTEGERYPKIVGYKLGAKPEYSAPEEWVSYEELADFEEAEEAKEQDAAPTQTDLFAAREAVGAGGATRSRGDGLPYGLPKRFDEWEAVEVGAPKKLRAIGDTDDLPF